MRGVNSYQSLVDSFNRASVMQCKDACGDQSRGSIQTELEETLESHQFDQDNRRGLPFKIKPPK